MLKTGQNNVENTQSLKKKNSGVNYTNQVNNNTKKT